MNILPEIADIADHEQQQKRRRSFQSLAPLWSVVKVGAFGILFLTQLSMCNRLNRLQTQNAPALVQMADGTGVAVKAMNPNYRSTETIRSFLNEWIPLALNWDAEITGADGKKTKDNGEQFGNDRIPTETLLASFALTDDFRTGWLKGLVKEFKLPSYLSSKKQRIAVVSNIGAPKRLKEGHWSVQVVSSWYEVSPSDQSGKLFKYNKEFILNAVNQPVSPLKSGASSYEKAIYSVLAKGLRIQEIRNLAIH
ncbi:MAG: hypothetical protein WCD18_02040 [Thermosynechococcaceae cyanobacterium]